MNAKVIETPTITSFRHYAVRHNKYYGNPTGRVYCDPILNEGRQTPRTTEFVKTIGEITVVSLFSMSMVFSFYMIYGLKTGAISW